MNKMWKVYLNNKSFVDDAIEKMIERYNVLIGTVMSIPIYDYATNRYDNLIEFKITNIEGRNYFMVLV